LILFLISNSLFCINLAAEPRAQTFLIESRERAGKNRTSVFFALEKAAGGNITRLAKISPYVLRKPLDLIDR